MSYVPNGEESPSALGINMQGMTEQKNLLAALDAWQLLKNLVIIVYWIAGWFTMSITVFLRRNFGERYLSWPNLYCGYSVMSMVVFFGQTMLYEKGIASGGSAMALQLLFMGFIGLSLFHRFIIYRRNRQGGLWYSYSGGEAWPILFAPLSKIMS